jgi:hypothetical protein
VLAAAAGTGLMSEPFTPIIGLGVALPAGWAGFDMIRRR